MIVENTVPGEYKDPESEHPQPVEPVPLVGVDHENPINEDQEEIVPSTLAMADGGEDANLVADTEDHGSDSDKTASLHDADELVQEPEEENGAESQHVVVHTGDLVQTPAVEPSNTGDVIRSKAEHDANARIHEQGDSVKNAEDREDWFVPNASQKYYDQASSSSDTEELPRWKRVKTEKHDNGDSASGAKVPPSRALKAQPAVLKKHAKAASSPNGKAKASAQKQAVATAVATLRQSAAGKQTRSTTQDEALKRKFEKQQKELAEKNKIVADLAGAVKSLRKQLRESRVDRRSSLKGAKSGSDSRLKDEPDANGLNHTSKARTPSSRHALGERNTGEPEISDKETVRKRHPARMDVKQEYQAEDTEDEKNEDNSVRDKSYRQRAARSNTNKRKRASSGELVRSSRKGGSKVTDVDKFVAKLKAEQNELNSFVDLETARLKLKAPHLVYAKMNQYCFWPAILVTSYEDVPKRSILTAHPNNGGPKQSTEAGDRYMLVYFLGHNSWSWIPYPSRIKFFELGLDNKVRTQGKWFDTESYRKGLALANEEMDLITAPPKNNDDMGGTEEQDSDTDVEDTGKQTKTQNKKTKSKKPKKPKKPLAKSKSPISTMGHPVKQEGGLSNVSPSEREVKPGERNPFFHLLKDYSSSSDE